MSADCSSFSWEAVATAFAGLMAVGGATWVGLKQANIVDRQAQILGRQARLEELSLRAGLFERRFIIYEATRKLLSEIVAHADKPTPDTEREFGVALNASEFLFDRKHEQLV